MTVCPTDEACISFALYYSQKQKVINQPYIDLWKNLDWTMNKHDNKNVYTSCTFDQNFIDRNFIDSCIDCFIHLFIDLSINIIGMTTLCILFYFI
jgi:hypothetical protein